MRRLTLVFRSLILDLLILILFVAAITTGCEKAKLNHALALGWREFTDTGVQVSGFYGGDFTLAGRFMVQYPKAYIGPIFAASGSGLELSKADATAKLVARYGGTPVTYSKAALQEGKWHHVALVRSAGKLTLYLDGNEICPDGQADCSISLDSTIPSGVLRFGRPGSTAISGGIESQYYGFIDDVTIFKKALSKSQIGQLINTPRLTGSEQDLFAGFTFDTAKPDGSPLPAVLNNPVTHRTITAAGTVNSQYPHTMLVSQQRDSATDVKFLLAPNNQVALHLPFPAGEAWVVGQGWGGSASHYGRANFAWDFNLPNGAETKDKPYYPASPGMVIELKDDRTSCSGWPANHVDVQHAPGEIGVYLHHVKGSAAVGLNSNVVLGKKLANAGDTGNTCCGCYHLHFALHNLGESQAAVLVTFPAAFENYEVSTDNGNSWSKVVRGIPKKDEWIRNPEN